MLAAAAIALWAGTLIGLIIGFNLGSFQQAPNAEITQTPLETPTEDTSPSQTPEPTESDFETQQPSEENPDSKPVGEPTETDPENYGSIAGPQGPVGPIGRTGAPGPMGPPGPIGAAGSVGAAGETGATGPQGPSGPQGATGPSGEVGPLGPVGPTGPQGPSGIAFAESPLIYDGQSQTVSLDRAAFEYLSNLGYIDFDTSAVIQSQVGRLFWNAEDGTLNLSLGGGQVILQVGQEQVQLVKNATAATLQDGRAVRATGSEGGRVTVEYADSTIPAKSVGILGVLSHDIAPGEIGFVTVNGMVRRLDTTYGIAGSEVYLTSNGQLSTVRPVSGAIVALGYLVTSDAQLGMVFVDSSYSYVPGAGLPCRAGPLNQAGIYKWEEAGAGDYFLSCDVTP